MNEFWIDVGGTFTDCIGHSPDNTLKHCKVLSSGRIKGQVTSLIDDTSFIDTSINENYKLCDDFFKDYPITFLDEPDVYKIVKYNSQTGTFTLDRILKNIYPGCRYELSSGEEAPVLGIRILKNLKLSDSLGQVQVRLGTTRGTNALLERKGAEIAFVTTKGFGDLLEIGTQTRPELFELEIKKPDRLYKKVIEIDERVDADGNILNPLNEDDAVKQLKEVMDADIKSIAVCLLNSYINPSHEKIIKRIADSIGFADISVSSVLSPTIKALDRGDTAVVDAYLAPVIRKYIEDIYKKMPDGKLKLMTSSGGLVEAEHFVSKDSILSGPAGGVVGFAHVARQAGYQKAIGFDMGGTSTDVSRFDGDYEYQFTTEKAGVRIVAPMYAIETVAAGGGSICSYDGQKLLVGPESAGADPGPACYGRGGPLTVTDINLFNGKINEDYFPFRLAKNSVLARLEDIQRDIEKSDGRELALHDIADGFTQVANLKMAAAIKKISAARGYDPAEHVLVSFGGAGSQHACAIAGSLGINNILLHPLAGILSAYGMGMADVRKFAGKTVLLPYSDESLKNLESEFQALESDLTEQVIAEDIIRERVTSVRMLDLRFVGEDTPITVRKPDDGNYARDFEKMHRQLYGYSHTDRGIEIATIRVEVIGRTDKPEPEKYKCRRREPKPKEVTTIYFNAVPHEAGLFDRSNLNPGDILTGPCIVIEHFSTIVIDPGWRAEVNEYGDIILNMVSEKREKDSGSTERDPIRLELFNNHFSHIAVQMGVTLQRTALSVNVKERLDYSCAILDAAGNLVVNAPHMPVHLGAMGETVKGLINNIADIRPGDVYISNDPDLGGSHLPDLTVMTPVFDSDNKNIIFFTASRAHHAEMGGVRPGSFYPFARSLAEEGVILRNLKIVADGVMNEPALGKALTGGPYPSRTPDENIADIRAAIAANFVGVKEIHNMIEMYSWPVVRAYMGHIRDAADEKTRAAISKFEDGRYTFEEKLDDGTPLKICITIEGDRAVVDFTGTGPVNEFCLNANRAVVQAALIYCLRCLIHEDIPLNSGTMEPVEIIIPESFLNPPSDPDPRKRAAFVGGNVEISQRIVDVFFGALSVMAACQGTMNNFTFGSEKFGYYETICGGTGAGPNFNGTSAVHCHMTNTRMTDVEILEKEYPVRLRRFEIRKDSGGTGKHNGGDGTIREIEFLDSLEVSLLTQRRNVAPFGIAGGGPAKPGRNIIIRQGTDMEEELPPMAQLDVHTGDRLIIMTPGGGAYG